jgi:hypothetical protein
MTTKRTARKCCKKSCPNPAAPGRRTCGKHGKRRASRSTSHMPASYYLSTGTPNNLPIMVHCADCDRWYVKGEAHECSTRAGWIQIDRSALLARAGELADRMVAAYHKYEGSN